MLKLAGIVLILLTPTLAGLAVLGLITMWGDSMRWMRIRRHRATPAHPPLQRIAADLRRLRRDLIRLENAPDATPGRSSRLHAIKAAYGDSLLIACRVLEVPVDHAELERAPLVETYRLEAALRDRGLEVAPTAIR